MNKLPMGWVEVELGQLGSIHTGKTPSTKDKDNFGGDILFVKPADLDSGGYIHKTADYLSEKGLEQLPNLPKNSIMVTCIGNLGKVGITTQTCATNQQINSIIPNENFVNYKFLYYQILTLKNWLEVNSSATTVSIINKSKFSKAPIYLPPKAEQDHIATLLDNHLSQVATISQKLNDILPIIKQFRQSVLAQAVSGELIGLQNGFDTAEISTLSKIGRLIGGKTPSKSNLAYWENGKIDWVSAKDMKSFILTDSQDKITQLAVDDGMNVIPENSVLMVVRSGILAHSFPVALTTKPTTINQDLKAFIPKQEINAKFLALTLKGHEQDILRQCSKDGTTVSSIETRLLENFKFRLPCLPEQQQIVTEVERLFAMADSIETQVNEALERVGHLTQSILHQAFTGNLSADWRACNAELITGEHSATALLAQLNAQKTVKKTKKHHQ